MTLKHHRTLTEEKWAAFGYTKQILMIAGELERANGWLEKDDFAEVRSCYERAMELVYLTIAVHPDKARLKELLRFKEMLAVCYADEGAARTHNRPLLKALLFQDRTAAAMMGM
jgi:hypothetical protein